jgi:hypothetical protein
LIEAIEAGRAEVPGGWGMCCKRTMPGVEYEKDAGKLPGDGFAKCEGVAAISAIVLFF